MTSKKCDRAPTRVPNSSGSPSNSTIWGHQYKNVSHFSDTTDNSSGCGLDTAHIFLIMPAMIFVTAMMGRRDSTNQTDRRAMKRLRLIAYLYDGIKKEVPNNNIILTI
jgi:hypothetical protein